MFMVFKTDHDGCVSVGGPVLGWMTSRAGGAGDDPGTAVRECQFVGTGRRDVRSDPRRVSNDMAGPHVEQDSCR